MKKKTPPKGFTLLEVMMALAVLSLVLVSVFRLSAMSLAMDQSVRFNTIAPLLAQQKLSELILSDQRAPYQDSGRFEDNAYAGYQWQVSMGSRELELSVDEQDLPVIYRMDVAIVLENSPLSYKLRTYRIRKKGSDFDL